MKAILRMVFFVLFIITAVLYGLQFVNNFDSIVEVFGEFAFSIDWLVALYDSIRSIIIQANDLMMLMIFQLLVMLVLKKK
ncbi:hypothetical protein [Acholeplasma hippikon]|uniref:Uncharacterized protein n=1 Tax=Acholeplasma hippikon TaxID=264636 RepID=A0A449BJZ8_9MOLU|nr:hypothetical protein [Acholeplasma hippikon]VEU82774.1 Uncharacterised protein [Acholeplasma hippikon]